MFKFSHRTLIAISGLVWFLVGIFLLSLGLHFILDTIQANSATSQHFSILAFSNFMIGDIEHAALTVVTICLFIGYIKGRFVLSKSVKRQVLRILSLPNPANIKNIYSKGYYILLGSMIALGFVIRYLPISLDTRGAIDLTIGAALVNGALMYFRYATTSFSSLEKLTHSQK